LVSSAKDSLLILDTDFTLSAEIDGPKTFGSGLSIYFGAFLEIVLYRSSSE
jgi:hypothetical protein